MIQQITLSKVFPVIAVCDALLVSRAGYYAWRDETESLRAARDRQLLPLVSDIFWHHKRRYGARRIAVELFAKGQACGVEKVAKLLKMAGLRAIQPKSFVPKTTQSRHLLGFNQNLLAKAPPPTRCNQIWVVDITYIPLASGQFAYLSLVLDLFSRKVVGWELAETMTEPLVLASLKQAIQSRQPPLGLLHHSDRGGQYAGKQYRAILRRAGCIQSMSRAGDCYDNAIMESCFGTIKTELEMTEYDNISQARLDIVSYLAYYNLQRRHSSLQYLSPNQFEAQQISPAK